MDRDRYQRIKDLFIEASELEGEDRQRLLKTASAEDRKAVLQMLESGTLTFLDKSPVESSSRDGAEALRPGQRFGRYEIQKELGSGGGGRVYLAMDTNLRRQVAIKTLGANSAGTERRFAREAETASALNHPNIVTVYEAASEAGTSYIAMEYISGGTLRSYIPKKNGMAMAKFFDWSIQICDALATAHRAGLIHRDLKPGNIMITDRGVPKIVDFGLAKPAFENAEDTLTGAGVAVGTAGYMAPEQAAGREVDARADIFSLGCVLYEMVSGRRAFQGNSQIELLAATIHTEPEALTAAPAQIPSDLARIIHLCMRKDPAMRLQSAADIRLMLEELRQNLGKLQETSVVVDRRSPWKIAVGALLAGALLASAAYWYWDSRMKPAPRPHPITTMLTTDSGLSSQPALSSDGRLLFYASDRGGNGNLDIWMQQIGGGAPLQLTSGPEDESTPDVSHDATRIVFRSEKDGGGIYTMPVLGGEPMLLAQGGRNPKFSPDGQSIAYWTGRENAALLPGAASVFVIPIGGGEPRHVSSRMSAAMYPVWSPGGDELLMVGRKDPDSKREPLPDWWVVPLDPGRDPVATGVLSTLTKQRPPLHRPPMWQLHLAPVAWRTDGHVVFPSRLGDTANLWQIGIDPRTQRVSGNPEPLSAGAAYETEVAFARTPAADRLAFSSLAVRFDLWAIPIDPSSGMPTGAEIKPATDNASYELYPSVSHDGSTLAYMTSRGNARSLCIRDTGSGKETIIFTGPLGTPRISGDGKWVVFSDEKNDVVRIPTRGGAIRKLCTRCGAPTDVDATGERILLESPDTLESVLMLHTSTGKVTTAVPARERLFDAKLSHDGKWIAFHAIRPGSPTAQIFVAPLHEGSPSRPEEWIPITDGGLKEQSTAWSPDDKVIHFLSERDGFRCVWARRFDPATGKPVGPVTAVRHFHSARRSLQAIRSFDAQTSLAVTKDRVIVVLGDLTGNIWLRETRIAK